MKPVLKLLGAVLLIHSVDALTFQTSARAPVQKVRSLLQAMQEEMAKDAERDEAVHDKQACWCNSNINAKESSVSTSQTRIAALTSTNKRLTANSARWTTESEQMTKDIADAEATMASAEKMRSGQREAFEKEEARLVGLISEIDEAFKQVADNNEAAGSLLSKYQQVLRAKMDGEVSRSSNVDAFLNMNLSSTGRSFLQREPLKAEGVEAVLNGIKNDTATTLAATRGQESGRVRSHERLLQDKTTEVKALEEQKQGRRKAIADAGETKASNKDVITNLEVQVQEDSTFLTDVRARCKAMDEEWEQRQKTRGEEVAAIVQAMDILKEEAVKEAFLQEPKGPKAKSKGFWGHFSPGSFSSFLQEHAVSRKRQRLSEALLKVGQQHDLRLVTLALRVKIDTFAAVKKAIENMTASLEKEQKNEVKHRDYCVDQLDGNKADIQDPSPLILQPSFLLTSCLLPVSKGYGRITEQILCWAS
ncbi:unnamed protein product [Symbiodinium natans]|uniref:Uncharacterized protein n=1 Tax=Symbiodinium natans TaxID=878477 RepID=A0A812J1N6_9DINO|nr:unnamed protein product [Symbiodinium natans]